MEFCRYFLLKKNEILFNLVFTRTRQHWRELAVWFAEK